MDRQPIKIDEEFRRLIPPLNEEELAALESSLVNEGCRDALVVWNGWLIDGHNRFEICERRGITYRTIEREFEDRRAVRVWIRNNQIGRRNLSQAWRIELALQNKAELAEIGREKQAATHLKGGYKSEQKSVLSTVDKTELPAHDTRKALAAAAGVATVGRPSKEKSLSTVDNDLPKHNTQKEVAAAAGVATGTIAKAEVVKKEAPELWEKAKAGKITVNAAYKKAKKKAKAAQERRELAEAQAQINDDMRREIESVCDLRVCSCRELFKSGIKPDAVITDPPYPREFLPVFTELAECCKSAGVSLVAVMSGQTYLPEVMNRLCEHLKYRWTLAYMTPGGSCRVWPLKIDCQWKPVLLFGGEDYVFDVFKSQAGDKRFHGWGQSESGMADLVKRLTKPGQLVCDPFLGGGTTAVVSLALGRRFVGCDIDPACIEQTKARIFA